MAISIMAVTLRVMHDALVPAEVTIEMGAEPTHAHVKGDPMMNPLGTQQRGVFSEGLWARASSLGESESVAAHIEQLLTLAEGKRDLFQRVKRSGGRVDILVGATISDGAGGFRVDSAVVERLGRLGIDLDFDLYGE